MDRGFGIVRWSPDRTRSEFMTINVGYRILELYRTKGQVAPGRLDYEQTSRFTDFQVFGAYDWSPTVHGLVAIGTKNGDVHLLRVDDNSNDSIILPQKIPRTCQAVAFNTTGLLAVGLDRVRNDQCLQIWDVQQHLSDWNPAKKGWQTPAHQPEPIHKLETGVAITSTRFFEDSPQTLVVGVKNQSVRIHDLRAPTGAVITFNTRCNNNLAIDHLDPNYFASSSLDQPGVMIWDRRASEPSRASKVYTDSVDASELPWGCALKLNRVVDSKYDTTIRSLRYSRDQRGLLGVLSSAGELQFIATDKEYVEPSPENDIEGSPELLEVRSTHDLAYPWFNEEFGYSSDNRIVSFDWVPTSAPSEQPRVIARRSSQRVEVILKPSHTPSLLLDLIDLPAKAKHSELGLLPTFADGTDLTSALDGLRIAQAPDNTENQSTKPARLELLPIPSDEQKPAPAKGLSKTSLNHIPSSRERHELLLASMLTDANGDAVLPDRLNSVLLARIRKGYLFNCFKNVSVLSDDPWLQDIWTWVQGAEEAAAADGMVSGHLNLSYMGVWNVWHNDLGKKYESRLVDSAPLGVPDEDEWARALRDIGRRAGLRSFDSVPTKRPYHRQMGLAICGWGKSEDELERDLLALETKGLYTKAAAWALFEKNPQRAVESLKKGGKNLLFIGLALSLQIKGAPTLSKEERDFNMSDLSDMGDDPYLRAIYALISTGDWRAIANEASLPLRDRVGVALHNLDDVELPNWLNRQMHEAIETGDIEGIILSGLTDRSVDILSKYIEKFGDYQTATLLVSFVAPLYIEDFRIWQWRAAYQDLHNRNRLFVERCKFDVQSTKKSRDRSGATLIKPRPRQVTLRCMHCDTALANDLDNTATGSSGIGSGKLPASSAANADRNPLYPSGVHAGISCPKCGKHLPRCGVCLLRLGMPRSDKDRITPDPERRLANFMSFCMKCDHAFHADHARAWFQIHNECPIPECHCLCSSGGGGMSSAEQSTNVQPS